MKFSNLNKRHFDVILISFSSGLREAGIERCIYIATAISSLNVSLRNYITM